MPDNKEYIRSEDEFGSISISEEVICSIASAAVGEVKEFTLAGGRGRAVRVTLGDASASVDIAVSVKRGTKIPVAAAELQKSVCQALEAMAGLPTDAVNIHVVGLDPVEEKNR